MVNILLHFINLKTLRNIVLIIIGDIFQDTFVSSIIRKLEEVKNALLHDAILITTLQDYKFNRDYVDNEGGCNIKFNCKMNIDDIKLFLVNLSPNKYLDKSLEDVDIQYYRDYEFTDDCECIIYTPDSFNYNSED